MTPSGSSKPVRKQEEAFAHRDWLSLDGSRPPAACFHLPVRGMGVPAKVSSAAFLLVLLVAAIAAYQDRFRDWDWDLMAYSASAVSLLETDPVEIHAIVFKEAKTEVPGAQYKSLTAATSYRADLSRDPFHFAEQIPFYSVKPAYVELIVGLHRLGLTRIQAMKLISVASFVAFGVLFFAWAGSYLNSRASALLSGMFVLSQPILDLARISTPDALSVAMVFAALYALFEKEGALAGILMLSCSVFIRSDNFVLVVLVLCYLSLVPHSPVRIRRDHAVLLIAAVLASTIVIDRVGGYGWQTLAYHSVVQRLTNPAEVVPHVTALNYFHALAAAARIALFDWSSLLLFAFMATGCLLFARLADRMRDLLLLNVTASVLRILVYPSFEERYLVSLYAVIAVCLISVIAGPASSSQEGTGTEETKVNSVPGM